MNQIEIVAEELETGRYYTEENGYIYPILYVKVKNVSDVNIRVAMEVNFYTDGSLLGGGRSRGVLLAPGDEKVISAQSTTGKWYLAGVSEYSYKIMNWEISES
jgi:hypothetical protein